MVEDNDELATPQATAAACANGEWYEVLHRSIPGCGPPAPTVSAEEFIIPGVEPLHSDPNCLGHRFGSFSVEHRHYRLRHILGLMLLNRQCNQPAMEATAWRSVTLAKHDISRVTEALNFLGGDRLD